MFSQTCGDIFNAADAGYVKRTGGCDPFPFFLMFVCPAGSNTRKAVSGVSSHSRLRLLSDLGLLQFAIAETSILHFTPRLGPSGQHRVYPKDDIPGSF